MFPPDWSISTEWLFYVTFVPASFVLVRIRYPILALGLLSVVASFALMTLFHFEQPVVSALTPLLWHGSKVSAPVQGWLIYFCPYVRLPEFLAGALADKAYMARGDAAAPTVAGRVLVALCIAWCLAIVLVPAISELPVIGSLLSNFIFAPALALLLYDWTCHDTWISRILASRPLLFMGEISYSVYIWSWFAMLILHPQFVSSAASPLAYFNSSVKLVVTVVVTTVIAYGSYHLVERPARQRIRMLLMGAIPRRPKAEPALGAGGRHSRSVLEGRD